MYAQIALQLIFPGMFFTDNTLIKTCCLNTLWSHILAVEPLYYFAHHWLHIPEHMKSMHGFHYLSINTLPSTSLVQNFQEHFVYIATVGPAFLLSFFVAGYQHWVAIGAYLVLFDIINAFGHMNLRVRHPIFTHSHHWNLQTTSSPRNRTLSPVKSTSAPVPAPVQLPISPKDPSSTAAITPMSHSYGGAGNYNFHYWCGEAVGGD